jgi:hypothetical protein
LNKELLAYLRFHGYLLYPGIPNTTAVTQETDQSYGPFQSKLRTNLATLIDERLHAEKATTLANKEKKLVKWGRIMNSLKPPPSYEKWTHEDEVKLEEAQSDVVEMAHTALGHMVALKKKELLLAAREMSQEEFDQLVAARSEATESGRIGGGGVGAGEHDGGTDDNGSSIIEGERGAANVSIEAMSEGETDAV